MPEGDTIHSAARRIGAALVGRDIEAIETPHPRHSLDRWPQRLVVQFDGPVLELMTDSRTRFDRRLAELGPDPIADDFDERAFLRHLHGDDPARGLGEALLDQRNLAGFGNVWKSESCFLAEVDPWRRLAEVSDDEALRIVRLAAPLMRESAERGGRVVTAPGGENGSARTGPSPALAAWDTWVYGHAGRPCRRCGATIESRGQGDDNRTTYWCPGCQA